jgi:hypothetical protein
LGQKRVWNNSQAWYHPLGEQPASSPTLQVSKIAFPSPVAPGAILTYTIYYTVNEGTTGLTLIDTLPPGLTYLNCYGVTCSETGGVVTGSIGDLTRPAAGIVTLVAQVSPSVPGGTMLNNEVVLQDSLGRRVTSQSNTPVSGGPSTCANNLITNGDMESNQGWLLDWGGVPAQYRADPRGTGQSLAIGLGSGQRPGLRLWSSARQRLTLPAGQKFMLSLNYRPETDPRPGFDQQYVALLDSYHRLLKTWPISLNQAGQWQNFKEDISMYAGQVGYVYVGCLRPIKEGVQLFPQRAELLSLTILSNSCIILSIYSENNENNYLSERNL